MYHYTTINILIIAILRVGQMLFFLHCIKNNSNSIIMMNQTLMTLLKINFL